MGSTVAGDVPALEAIGLEKGYASPNGRLAILQGLDLIVKRGTILAIIGVSGVGKSTLLNILGTLDRPDHGTVRIAGQRIDGLSEAELAAVRARRIGFVFQVHHLLPEFTAEENVMMPLLIAGEAPERARVRSRAALSAVGLHERWAHRPSELSGGEAQRVAVARALAPEPALVLADEPSGNLDSLSADALHGLLASLAREQHRTLVIVTHNDRLAGIADQVLRLDAGRLALVRDGRV